MKKILFFSAAALALASCSNDEFLGEGTGQGPSTNSSAAIGFGTEAPKATRANFEGASAAEKLNNNFIVYGFKYYNTEPTAAGTGLGQVGNPEAQQKVFDRYNVHYTEGTNNTTESNTEGWEYVGLSNHDGSIQNQTIKYWDYETTGYVFSAVSGTGITADKIESVANGPAADSDPAVIPMAWAGSTLTREEGASADKYDKGWVVTIPEGGSLSDLYASERVDVTKASNKYQKTVSLKFYNMGAKIRFAMYETVPGYSIQIDKFYYTDGGEQNSETNFAIDADKNFTTLKTGGDSKLIVTYYNSGTLENRPKVTPLDGNVNTASFGLFGTNIQPTAQIGTNSTEATYDQADKSYTDIIPCDGGKLSLKVDYTLTSTDGSNETIHVKGATATVPANFTEWKANFAYTYLFKISDNTNGTTGTGSDPKGLYPITFDAVVVGNEDGIQETITSVADPSITTYQKGVVVTANDEYVAGEDIYFENSDADISTYHVYEVNNYSTEATTEEVVANWKNNFCVLTEVTVTKASAFGTPAGIPLSDGSFIPKSGNQAARFTPAAGKTYVIVNNTADNLNPTATIASGALCKVVKVSGDAAAITYGLTASSGTITATDGKATVAFTQNSVAALGAKKCIQVKKGGDDVTTQFAITDATTAGSYDIQFTDDAIKSGAAKNNTAGTYTVNVLDEEGDVLATVNFTVTLAYSLTVSVDIEAGDATGADATLTVVSTDYAGAVIVNENEGITITDNANGTYTVTAKETVKNGAYTATIGGETLTINVTNYQFVPTSYVYTKSQAGNLIEDTHVILKTYEDTPAVAAGIGNSNITVSAAGLTLAGTNGDFTVNATAAGVYTLTKDNTIAKATVTVNAYTFTAADANIAENTGSTTLTLQKNNGTLTTENANTTKVTVKKNGTVVTTGFKLTTNGQKLTFSNVSAPGVYTFEYQMGATPTTVATAKVIVGEETLTASTSSIAVDGTSTLTYKVAGTAVDGGAASVDTGVDGTNWTIVNNSNGTYTFTGKTAGTYTVTIGTKSVTITVS